MTKDLWGIDEDSSSSAQNDLVFIVILSDRRESKDLRLIDGERCGRCLWQIKRAERVAAVGR